MRVPGSDSYYKLMVTSRQTGAAPLTPRTAKNRCGTCAGSLVFDDDFKVDKCQSCSRLAGPAPPPTPEEIRQGVLAELDALFEDSDPAVFWKKYVSVTDLSEVLLTGRKVLMGWCYNNNIKPTPRRHPDTGKRSLFLTVTQAKEVIVARR